MESRYSALETEEDRPQATWKNAIARVAPIVAVAVVFLAVVIALIARDVSRTNEMMAMNNKLQQLEASVAAQQQSISLQADVSHSLVSSVRKFVPAVCNLECHNGGVPDESCTNCTRCQDGFGGRWCHVPAVCADKCDNPRACSCRRGGSLDLKTCACNCPPGWTGARCQNPSVFGDVPIRNRTEFIAKLFQQAQDKAIIIAEQRKRAMLNGEALIPNHLGNGAIGLTRALKLAVLEPTMPADLASAHRFVTPTSGNSYIIPERVQFELSGNTGPIMKSEMFDSMKDYVAHLNGMRQNPNGAPPSLLTKQISDMANLFMTYPESFVTLNQQTRSLYTLRFDVSAAASYESFRMEENCARALDYLPNEYNAETKSLYDLFLDYWGDSFVAEVTEGGFVESIHALHKGFCRAKGSASNAYLTTQQRAFMGKFYGLPGQWTTDSVYEAHAATDVGGCSGGNVVMCEEQLKSKVDYTPWTNTLWDLPSPVQVKLRPMTDMIRDPTKKAAMQAAIEARNAELTKDYVSPVGRTLEFCPSGLTVPPKPREWLPIYGIRSRQRFYRTHQRVFRAEER